MVKNINYLQKGDHASGLVSSEWFGANGKMVDSLKYVYDKEGNVTAVKENGEEVTTYKYDGLNRLVREDNKNLNKSYCFRYDMGGNIVERVELPYTKVEEIGGTKYTYTYGTNGWRDQLQSYNGQAIIYNSMGNPTSYRGQAAEWSYGRQLTKLGTTTYKYSSGGNRMEKKVGSETTKYYYTGSKLIAQDNGTAKLYFYYGVEGINSFTYKVGSVAKEYTYKKNILGDILGIYDSVGVEIIKYTYDAWGNHILKVLENGKYIDIASNVVYNASESEVRKVAKLNPFRYRGYYFDLETGLYWLQTRYYDSELGMFINADDISYLDPETIGGLNLYAYCLNNPVMNYDPTGNFAISIFLIGLIGGAFLGGVTGGINAYNSGARDWDLVGGIALGTFTGAVLGASVGVVAGLGGAFLAGGISSAFSKLTTDIIAYTMFATPIGTWEDYAIAFIAGGFTKKIPWLKAGVDIIGRPLVTQLAKWGTGRQSGFQLDKFGYDIATRALTFGIPAPWKSFARGITRGIWSWWKKGVFSNASQGQYNYA